MSERFIITIDDSDRDDCPETPWTASVCDAPTGTPLAAGVGDSPKHAVRNIDWAEVAIAAEVIGFARIDEED